MARETARNAVLALLGVLAVSLSAATLSNPVHEGGRDGEFVPPPAYDTPAATIDDAVLLVFAGVAALGVLYYLYLHRRTLFRRVALFVGVVLVTYLAMYFGLFDGLFGDGPSQEPLNRSVQSPVVNGTSVNESGGSIAAQPEFQFTVAWLVIGFLCLTVLVVAFRWVTPDENADQGGETSTDGVAAVGRAAGRAADRIEGNADVDNEVYRAWREMAELVDPASPETRTPGEFERSAVEVGMDRADVHELTRLFERVRYGADEPVEDDERRAVEIFRRIERTYAEDEP